MDLRRALGWGIFLRAVARSLERIAVAQERQVTILERTYLEEHPALRRVLFDKRPRKSKVEIAYVDYEAIEKRVAQEAEEREAEGRKA